MNRKTITITRTIDLLLATVFVAGLVLPLGAQTTTTPPASVTFNLTAQPAIVNCLGVPGGPAPTATVTITRGQLNDTLTLSAQNLKPNLAFDLFTIQNTNLTSSGQPDPNFKNFGLAWYQSDLQADANGSATVTVQTILLDQIFGFDAAVNAPSTNTKLPQVTFPLPPTHTFHLGFWFNNPQDAVACGFNAAAPTPFNGENKAGPNAMISLPDATTNLGPLCTQPLSGPNGFTCQP